MRVAIVGLGLIGGSLARRLVRSGHHVVGVDRPVVAARARRARAVSETARTLEAAAAAVDLLVLAAPPRVNLALVRRAARAQRPGLVVTDVGSVKGPICREARRLRLGGFVGGHPMAGSEGSGFAASDPDLFRGRTWILTGGAPRALERVRRLVRAAGARPAELSPRAHDRAIAFLSHLPQLVSWALLATARRDAVAGRHLELAGPGFRGMTRLARSPRALWDQILGENAAEVARALRVFLREVSRG